MTGKGLWYDSIRKMVRPLLYELIIYSFFINVLALVIPLFVLQVYNRVVAFGNVTTLQGLVVGVLIALSFDFALRQIRSKLLQKSAMRIDVGLSEKLATKIWSLPLRILEDRPTAYWQGLFRDIETVRNTVAGPPFLLLIDLPFALLFVGLIFIIAQPIAWIFVSIIPVFMLLALFSGRMVGNASDEEKASQRKRDSLNGDMIVSRSTVKSLSLDAGISPYWEDAQANCVEASMKRGMKQDGFVNAGTVFTLVTTVIITSFGALAIIDQTLSIGALIAANMLSNRVIGPFSQLVGFWKNYAAYRQAHARLDQIMTTAEERSEETIQLDRPKGDLQLEEISFRYDTDGAYILEELSAHFASNSVHMIMGPNGGGKSTLIKILKGLYIPESGRVMIDGADLLQFTRKQLAKWIGYVPQETVLIDGTIKDNITGRRDYISDEQVVEICKETGVHNTILKFPKGYSTHVGEMGHAMSGGMRQRIAIARALIDKPPVLIFDEPSASLDRHAEAQLQKLLVSVAKNCTVILVSHSPLMLNASAFLHLLDKNRIVMSGPRDEILKKLNKQTDSGRVGSDPLTVDRSKAEV